jgi:hydroxyacylglutathione hydrolase
MTIEILSVPCLADNFAYLLRDREAGRTVLVDAPEAAPILGALRERGWGLDEIWLTHHHDDHVQGVPELREAHPGVEVVGGRADAHRLPPLDRPVGPNATLELGAHRAEVIDVPGHTVGHMAFHMPDAEAAFTADSLMAMGCGRLFEGTPEQMWDALSHLMTLPEDTVLYTGHDYMETNLRFAATIEPENTALRERAQRDEARRSEGRTMPHPTLALEMATNPMLRAGRRETKAALGMEAASDLEVFTEIRRRRDGF